MLDQETRDRIHDRWREYLASASYCSVVLFILMLILDVHQLVVVASIGATAFIVFAMPKSKAAGTANTVGGHAIGLLTGSLASLIPHSGNLSEAFVYALAVGLCSLLMLLTRYKHPPAAATALGIAVAGIKVGVIITVIVCVLLLSLIRIVTLNLLYDFSRDDDRIGGSSVND